MKQLTKQNWLTTAALLLALPSAYFIAANILNELGMPAPYDAIASFVERNGGTNPLGWNINLLILLGPIVACLLTAFQVLKIEWQFTKEVFHFHFTIRKKWFPLLVSAFSLSLLAILFIYSLGENCNCI